MIFERYANEPGITLNGITRRLIELGIPTPSEANRLKGGNKRRGFSEWGRPIVHRILSNETYIGRWQCGKHRQTPANGGKYKSHLVKNPESYRITLEVPALIDAETWERVQERLKDNRRSFWKEPKGDYLLRHRLTCGECGGGMRCAGVTKKGKRRYSYYKCLAQRKPLEYSRQCASRCFRADHVDAVVWQWVKGILSDPAELQKAATVFEAESEREAAPLRQRLNVSEDLLQQNQAQLDKLLDLYLCGDFDKSVLIDRKTRLEEVVKRLTKERDELARRLSQHISASEGVRLVTEFSSKQAANVEKATRDFAVRRGLMDDLQVSVTLVTEKGEKVVYARCVVGDKRLLVDKHNSC
jgi:site-specific DNA recombinase